LSQAAKLSAERSGKRSIGQEIDRAAPFQVDEDGAVAVSAPEGEIIDAEDARRGPLLRVGMLQMPQQGIRAEAKTEAAGDRSGGFPSNQIGQFSQGVQEARRLSGVALRDVWQWFGEDTAPAVAVIAEELATGDLDAHRVALPREIQQGAWVTRVDSLSGVTTEGAVRRGGRGAHREDDDAGADANGVERHASRVRQQGMGRGSRHAAVLPLQ